jgi:predicted GNAT superfamily acetyltransferase
MKIVIRMLESPVEIAQVEDLQRVVWPGSELDIIPAHLLLAAVHNGGVIIGAYEQESAELDLGTAALSGTPANSALRLVGAVFGFLGFYSTADGQRLKHCSHILAVHPDYRNQGVGFSLKRAQWQIVRQQGVDLITWTYDPLLSRNAHLNITRLGGVCSTYLREYYGVMRDGLNAGLPSDRFQLDWWVNSHRVNKRLSQHARRPLDLAHYFAAGTAIINPTILGSDGFSIPANSLHTNLDADSLGPEIPLLLAEIPADFLTLKAARPDLAHAWRLHSRSLFEDLFARGYLITDFIYLPGTQPRSFYVFTHGESTI